MKTTTRQRVLFLCTGNSARSQMAEGLPREIAGDRFEVFSAGTRPSGLNPNAVTAMAEIGIDISRHRSKSVDEFDGQQLDYVITVCDNAKESCPILAGAGKRVHHSFEDPAAAPANQQLPLFRKVRDEMSGWLHSLPSSWVCMPRKMPIEADANLRQVASISCKNKTPSNSEIAGNAYRIAMPGHHGSPTPPATVVTKGCQHL